MLIDIRYHVASLFAVFLALGLGIVVGVIVSGRVDLAAHQADLVHDLEERFRHLKEEQRRLGQQVSNLEKQVADDYELGKKLVVTGAGQGPPAGSTAIFLTAGPVPDDQNSLMAEMADVLNAVGCRVIGHVAIRGDWGAVDARSLKDLGELLGTGSDTETISALAGAVIQYVSRGLIDSTGVIGALKQLKLITINPISTQQSWRHVGESGSGASALIVPAGTGAETPGPAMDLVIETAVKQDIKVVVTRSISDTGNLWIRPRPGIVLVDNIDTFSGQVALLECLGIDVLRR